MTNEELAVAIQNGDRDRIPELWEQTRRFVWFQAKKWYRVSPGQGGAEMEDLIQSGFFALLTAVETYDGSKEKSFIGWLALHLKRSFSDTIGIRTELQRRDPLRTAVSLDAPAGDDENGDELQYFIADPNSEDWIKKMELQECHEALFAALRRLPGAESEIIRLRYWGNLSQADTAKIKGITVENVSKIERRALSKLRNPMINRGLMQFLR